MADDGAQVARISPEDAYHRAEQAIAKREGRDRLTLEILRAALDEFHRLSVAIQVDGALGWPAPHLALVIRPLEQTLAMTLDSDLTGLQLGRLQSSSARTSTGATTAAPSRSSARPSPSLTAPPRPTR